ncbi:MAG: FAD:protein FMN transferase [Epulopiscium sp.]|nr:FAD:protein FMN transferase [Candidatus Epulonipiscium sp.]
MKINKYKILLLITILPISLSLSACHINPVGLRRSNLHQGPAEKTQLMLGTVISASAYGENADHALDLAFTKVDEIDKKMSRYREGSEVDLINQNAGIGPVKVSPETFYVIERSLDYARQTDGAFNPLIGELVDLWAIGTENEKVPDKKDIDNILPSLDYNYLKLNKDSYMVELTSDKVRLDLGAIAKGYAADVMRDVLLEEGIDSALLNLGGNVIVIGRKPDGNPWAIGVQDPLGSERGEIAGIVNSIDTSVVTSGHYERFFESDGKRYHHIFDPFTGYPAEKGVISSTIICPSSIDADALSTSIFVLGKDKGLELIEATADAEAIIITEDLLVFTSSGINDDLFELRNEALVYEKSR